MNKYTQWKIQEIKEQKMISQHGVCPSCGKSFRIGEKRELAHILPKRKDLLETYGDAIINHPLNMVLTHTGICNSHAQISPNKTELVKEHIQKIREALLDT
jgi:transposase-like protein